MWVQIVVCGKFVFIQYSLRDIVTHLCEITAYPYHFHLMFWPKWIPYDRSSNFDVRELGSWDIICVKVL